MDVRTVDEYRMGHVPGSINIPLQEIRHRLSEISTLPQPLIACCASGIRSAQAVDFLRHHGITCEDGGSWKAVYDMN